LDAPELIYFAIAKYTSYLLAAEVLEVLRSQGYGNVTSLGFSSASGFLSELCFGTDRSCRQFWKPFHRRR